jgi:hypothetical protein
MLLFERRLDPATHENPVDDQPFLLRETEPVLRNEEGRVGPPILLWLLGVPGGLVLLLWLFFFRG